MVSDGNHPLNNQPHYDEEALHEYVLGQKLPDEEAQIRQHLEQCPRCRAAEGEIRAFCQRVALDLHHELADAEPLKPVSFDAIAAEWRKPPRRISLLYRVQVLAPGVTLALLLVLLVTAILVLLPSEQATTLRGLDLVGDYSGPPAIIAASTDNGLVIVRLSASGADVVAYLPNLYSPRQLQFSPDARWLAFQQGRTLYILDAEHGSASTRFSVQDSAEWAWSPDGRWLAYTDGHGQLAVFDTQGTISRVLVPASELVWGPPVWTADSQQIAYAVVKPLPNVESVPVRQSLWRVSVDTGYRIELARNPSPSETLLVPSAWDSTADTLLAWDMHAASAGQPPALYRVDVSAHSVERMDGYSVAQGTRLAWPVSSLGTLLMARDETSVMVVQLAAAITGTPLTVPIPWPQSLEWAPNGAWFAYTTAGAAEGEGVYLFALEDSKLRPVKLPSGAAEKDVLWAGAEHLFVIREPQGASISELWLVPLTGSEPPLRIMTNLRLPVTGPYHGWRWRDILAAQVIGP